jgi:uncharacterized protein (TIGR02271 family)
MSSAGNSGSPNGAPLQRAAWIDGDSSAQEARIGDSRRVRGGARVTSLAVEPPASEASAPVEGRVLSEAEIAASGLFQERVIEIGEMREEAVVSKQAVVREEVVVRKDVEERTERVSETLRRTEVQVEQIEAAPEPAGDDEDVRAR